MTTTPDWAIKRAQELQNAETPSWSGKFEASAFSPSTRAFARYIAKHEQPPVTRKELCAQEAFRLPGPMNPVGRCIRAIELWEEGFGA